jgi:recombinational DNA repair protein (RecF pathway)
MLYAEAKSVREERSRQRMSLQDFSYVRVSLVKGKSSWKIGSIEPRVNFFMHASDKAARGSVVALTKFLRRFYGQEEAVPHLFDYIRSALSRVSEPIENRVVCELIIKARVLSELGYIDRATLPLVVQEELAEVRDDTEAATLHSTLTPMLEKAISQSHL